MSYVSSRPSAVEPSAALAVSQSAEALRAMGVDLLDEGRAAAAPGVACGLSPFVRISTATGDAVPTEAVARIGDAVSRLD